MSNSNVNSKVNDFLFNLIYNTEKVRQSVESRLSNPTRNFDKSTQKVA